MTKKISIVFGTRPEAIKLSPIILSLRNRPDLVTHVCLTGQHDEMLYQVLDLFDVKPDYNYKLMKINQSLADFTSRAITALDKCFEEDKPDFVLVQGDTSSTFAASLAAFYHKIPIGHVEAGLRTGSKYSPFPEEINRAMVTRLADCHFAPTETSKSNLLKEGVSEDRIFVTGNTVVDALRMVVVKARRDPPVIKGLPDDFFVCNGGRPLVLITGHRRENFGGGFRNICAAIARLADTFPETAFVYPVHLNPHVQEPVFKMLGGRANIYLLRPLGYLPFVALMDRCKLILTDSGGLQEEAPSIGKPVLVLRDTTERPEVVQSGNARLVGTDSDAIVRNATELLVDNDAYQAMAQACNPYGDGRATERIVRIILCETAMNPNEV